MRKGKNVNDPPLKPIRVMKRGLEKALVDYPKP